MGVIISEKVQHARDSFRGTYDKLLESSCVALPEFLRDLRSHRVIYRALKDCGLPRELEREMTILALTLYVMLGRAPPTSNRQFRRWITCTLKRLRRERVAMEDPYFMLGGRECRALTDEAIAVLERFSLLPQTPRGPKVSPITAAVWMLVGLGLEHKHDVESRALARLAIAILEPAVDAASSGPDGDAVDWRDQIVRALRERCKTP